MSMYPQTARPLPKIVFSRPLFFNEDTKKPKNNTQLVNNPSTLNTAAAPYPVSKVNEMMYKDIDFQKVEYIVICYKKMDRYMTTSCLNKAANVISKYIHCEIWLTVDGISKSLYITAETGCALFETRSHDYEDSWVFQCILLPTIILRRRLLTIVKQLVDAEKHRHFSKWNIYCFPCFGCCFMCHSHPPSTRTCSETTIRVLNHVFELRISDVDCFRYTPENIYTYVESLAFHKIIELQKIQPPEYVT